jgi:hypothetical protein
VFLLKYSFNANTTRTCILKMSIIALFLHILWDRKCKVTDSRFRSRQWFVFAFKWPRIQISPQLKQNGEPWTHSCAWHTAWVHPRMTCAQATRTTHMHDTHSQTHSSSPAPHQHTWLKRSATHRPCARHPSNALPITPERKKKKSHYLRK